MTERVVVDPITRIEGHLRIEAQMNGGSSTFHVDSRIFPAGLAIR